MEKTEFVLQQVRRLEHGLDYMRIVFRAFGRKSDQPDQPDRNPLIREGSVLSRIRSDTGLTIFNPNVIGRMTD